jgi:hypothetical protein
MKHLYSVNLEDDVKNRLKDMAEELGVTTSLLVNTVLSCFSEDDAFKDVYKRLTPIMKKNSERSAMRMTRAQIILEGDIKMSADMEERFRKAGNEEKANNCRRVRMELEEDLKNKFDPHP